MTRAVDQRVNRFVGADRRAQRVHQVFALDRWDITIRRATLNDDGRVACVDEIHRIGGIDQDRDSLDGSPDQLGFERAGIIMILGTACSGKLIVHFQEINRSKPAHNCLHAARLGWRCTIQRLPVQQLRRSFRVGPPGCRPPKRPRYRIHPG